MVPAPFPVQSGGSSPRWAKIAATAGSEFAPQYPVSPELRITRHSRGHNRHGADNLRASRARLRISWASTVGNRQFLEVAEFTPLGLFNILCTNSPTRATGGCTGKVEKGTSPPSSSAARLGTDYCRYHIHNKDWPRSSEPRRLNQVNVCNRSDSR